MIRDFLEKELQIGCMAKDDFNKLEPEVQDQILQEAKASYKALHGVRFGSWIYHPDESDALCDEKVCFLAAQNLDERRIYKYGSQVSKTTELTQIWFYGKHYMSQQLEEILRKTMIEAVANDVRKQIQAAMKNLYRIVELRSARIEFVEINFPGDCVSAQKNDFSSLLRVLRTLPSSSDVTVFFRERHWQSLVEDAAQLVTSPFSTIRRSYDQWRDEWNRYGALHKVGMIVMPILRVLNIAGLVFGLATGGGSVAVSLIADAILSSGAAAWLLGTVGSYLAYLVDKAVGAVVSDVKGHTQKHIQTNRKLQKVLSKFDESDIMYAERMKMQAEISSLYNKPEVQERLQKFHDNEVASCQGSNEPKCTPEAIEEAVNQARDEARRTIEGCFYSDLRRELLPQVEKHLRLAQQRKYKDFGWLKWNDWKKLRTDKGLEGKKNEMQRARMFR
jgi:hypothetical protein